MRRALLFLCLIAMCLSFGACDPAPYGFDYAELSEGLVCVELIRYDNPKQEHFSSWVPDHSDDLQPFDVTKMTVLQRLETENHEAFLRQLCEAEILDTYYAYDSPNGYCLKLGYENGDFLILNCDTQSVSFHGYIGKYNAEGEVLAFIGCFSSYRSFEKLVSTYFTDNRE